jgi:aminoglycoside/choline kinase family phosphotransferase
MNEQAQQDLQALYERYAGTAADKIVFLTQAGSDRQYFRLFDKGKTFIGTYSPNRDETEAFLQFTRHFTVIGLPVPAVLAEDAAKNIYLQEDLGDISLFRLLQEFGGVAKYEGYLKEALSLLAIFQVKGHEGFDYNWAYSGQSFDQYGMVSDMNYWKYYFLRPLQIGFDGHALDQDFAALADWLLRSPWQYFMYRDFQSRNIMLQEGQLKFIDYQGGRSGPALYDCASLLWQAKSGIGYDKKQELAAWYMQAIRKESGLHVDAKEAQAYYEGFVLLRLLQVLGAYGYRGLFERKQHFLSSIPLALENLQWWKQHASLPLELPELNKVLELVTGEQIMGKFSQNKSATPSRLNVSIYSFSYKQGLPVDNSGNGGGFVFDCRFIDNPGRKEAYKTLTGLDEPVKNYLSTTAMPGFMEQVFNIIDKAVENYIERDFEDLSVSFGCTGGQHRSVYAADALAAHLEQRYPVQVTLQHIEQEKKKNES